MRLSARRFTLLLGMLLVITSSFPHLAVADTTAPVNDDSVVKVAAKANASVVGILTSEPDDDGSVEPTGAGTGFVYRDGVIITNAHVVRGASDVKILYPNHAVESVSPTQIFSDAISDIAVIKVTTPNLVPLSFADSDHLQVGQQVVAVGNPLGFRLGNSVTAGILSGIGRAMGTGYPYLQIDAPINPGNSGGPLFDLQGDVIGINSAKMYGVGLEGLGFAIPINTARDIAERLLRDGKVDRATLGISLYEDWKAEFGVPDAAGVTISQVIFGGPAGLTALESGDKLVKLNDTAINTVDDVYTFLAGRKPGDWVTVTASRRGQTLQVSVQLASQEQLRLAIEGQATDKAAGGIWIDLTADQIQQATSLGRSLAKGRTQIAHGYTAESGDNVAVLYTEYLYVAQRMAAAYEFGFTPGSGYRQAVARDINRKLEVQMALTGNQTNFLDGATYTLQAGDVQQSGTLQGIVTYTTSPDGQVVLANLAVRFPSDHLNPAANATVTVTLANGKTIAFTYHLANLQ